MFNGTAQPTRTTRSTAAALKQGVATRTTKLATKEINKVTLTSRKGVLNEKTNDERVLKENTTSKAVAKGRPGRAVTKTTATKTTVTKTTAVATKEKTGVKPRTRSQTRKEVKPTKAEETVNENSAPAPAPAPSRRSTKRSSSRSRREEASKEEQVQTVAKKAEVEHENKKQKTEDWEDFDAEDANDPMMVSEYVKEIFEYMKELEVKTMPCPNYIEQHPELAWRMRGILIDWLVEVHGKFKLLPETLFLTVNLMDRFLSLRVCSLPKFQLVGITAMFIAAKYEEVMAPSIHNFVYMSDGSYSVEEIQQAERYMLKILDFDLSFPNPLNFLRRVSKADNYDIQVRTLAKYFMEVALIDYRFLGTMPSMVSAAAMWLSRKMLGRGEWNANLIHYSGYTEEELQPTVDLMINYLSKPTKHESFFKKYASKKFMKASIFAKEWIEKNYQ